MTNDEHNAEVREATQLIAAKHAQRGGYEIIDGHEIGNLFVWTAPEGKLKIEMDLRDA